MPTKSVAKAVPPAWPGIAMPDKIGKDTVVLGGGGRWAGQHRYRTVHDAYYGRRRHQGLQHGDTGRGRRGSAETIARKMFLSEAHWFLVGCCSIAHPAHLRCRRRKRPIATCHGTCTGPARCRLMPSDNLLRLDEPSNQFKCPRRCTTRHRRGVIPSRHQTLAHPAHGGHDVRISG